MEGLMFVHNKQQGYILVLTMLLVFMATVLVTRLLKRSFAEIQLKQLVIEREKAKVLALSGVSIVQEELFYLLDEKQKKNSNGEKTVEKEFNQRFLELSNQWKTYEFQEKRDGIEGTLQLYVSCEDGKIPLNTLFDFEKKVWKKDNGYDIPKLLSGISLQHGSKNKEQKQLSQELARVLKKRGKPLEDLSQLFTDTYFKRIALHSFPDVTKEKDDKKLFMYDVFTVAHDRSTIQPVFLSSDIKKAFGMKPLPREQGEREKKIKKVIANLQEQNKWDTVWDRTLAELHGSSYSKLSSALTKFFDEAVGATTISVLSYGKIGGVTQKIYALLERSKSDDSRVSYVVRKLYWL